MTRIIQNREKISAYAYMGFVLLMSAAKAVGLNQTNPIYRYIGIVAMAFGAVAICSAKYVKEEMIVLLGLGGYAALVCYLSHQMSPALLWVALAGAKHADGKRLIQYLYYIWIVGFISVISLSALKIIPSHLKYDNDHMRYRSGLGYDSGNMAQIVIFIIITMWGYTKKRKKIWIYLLFAGVNCLVYLYTDSRLGFYAAWVSLLTWMISDIADKNGWVKIENILLKMVAFVPCFISIIIVVWGETGNTFWDTIDHLMTHRVMIIEDATRRYGVGLFAKDLPGYWWVVDNVYANMLLRYGIVYFMLFMALYVWLILLKDENYIKEKLVAVLMLICGMVEQFIQNCFLNFSLLLIIFLIWENLRARNESANEQ